MESGITMFVVFSAILRLSRDWSVVTGEGNRSTQQKTPPRHWQLSHMPWVGFKPGQWWGTASSQCQRVRPYGHRGRARYGEFIATCLALETHLRSVVKSLFKSWIKRSGIKKMYSIPAPVDQSSEGDRLSMYVGNQVARSK